MQTLQLNQIRMDGGTQSRVQLDWIATSEYAQAMIDGAQFPPAVVFYDGTEYWLADGFHRIKAAEQAGLTEFPADVRQGTRRDAILYSVGANANHGVRRTNADKRAAVLLLLGDEEWKAWPQTKIARACGVTPEYVSRIVSQLSIDRSIDGPKIAERNGTTYTINTENIGKRTVVPLPQPEPQPLPAWASGPEPTPTEQAGVWGGYPKDYETTDDIYAEAPDRRVRPHVTHNSGNNEWYTPEPYIEAARRVLGGIDLDPASSDEANQVVKATRYYTVDDDGLAQAWQGNVYMNPPYSTDLIGKFGDKLLDHLFRGDVPSAIVLVNNATDTAWFHNLATWANSLCFPRGRIRFWSPSGELGAPLQGQAILYFGEDRAGFAAEFSEFGIIATI